MTSFKNYNDSQRIVEEFNTETAKKDALKWLANKYGELFTFKHIEKMEMGGDNTKTYDIVVGENTYKLNLRKFDSNGDGDMDTVGFDIEPDAEEVEDENEL